MDIDFVTPRPIEECRQLLAMALEEGVAGRRDGDRFEVHLPSVWYGRLDLAGQLAAEPAGTRVQARLKSSVWAYAGIVLLLFLIGAIALIYAFAGDMTPGYRLGMALFALGGGSLLAIRFMRRVNGQDRARVQGWVTELFVSGRILGLSRKGWAAKRVELAVDISAPPGAIWAVLTDPTGFPDWITGMQSVEMLTEGEYGVGTRYQVTAGTGSRTVEWTVEITGLGPERRIDYRYTGDVEGRGGWTIEPDEDGIRYWVTSWDEFAPPGGWLVKLLSRLWLDNAARAARRESLERLKQMLEAEG